MATPTSTIYMCCIPLTSGFLPAKRILECPQAPVVGEETPRISSSFSSATSCTHQSKSYCMLYHIYGYTDQCNIYNHVLCSTYQWVPASKDAHTVKIFPQLLVYLWNSAKLTNLFLHFLKEVGWNRLVSHLGVKQITDRGRADELVRL